MLSIYLDECMVDHDLVRPLRRAGHLLYLPSEQGVSGAADDVQPETATRLGAVIVTQNQRHFIPPHHHWEADQRPHAGILLVAPQVGIGRKIALLERALRLLPAENARNQLLQLAMFNTEELAESYVASLAR